MRRRTTLALTAVALLVLSGCGVDGNSFSGGFKDLENIPPEDPTNVRIYNNVDGFPNIVILCTDGVAWATTTRDGFAAVQRVEALDRTCDGGPLL